MAEKTGGKRVVDDQAGESNKRLRVESGSTPIAGAAASSSSSGTTASPWSGGAGGDLDGGGIGTPKGNERERSLDHPGAAKGGAGLAVSRPANSWQGNSSPIRQETGDVQKASSDAGSATSKQDRPMPAAHRRALFLYYLSALFTGDVSSEKAHALPFSEDKDGADWATLLDILHTRNLLPHHVRGKEIRETSFNLWYLDKSTHGKVDAGKYAIVPDMSLIDNMILYEEYQLWLRLKAAKEGRLLPRHKFYLALGSGQNPTRCNIYAKKMDRLYLPRPPPDVGLLPSEMHLAAPVETVVSAAIMVLAAEGALTGIAWSYMFSESSHLAWFEEQSFGPPAPADLDAAAMAIGLASKKIRHLVYLFTIDPDLESEGNLASLPPFGWFGPVPDLDDGELAAVPSPTALPNVQQADFNLLPHWLKPRREGSAAMEPRDYSADEEERADSDEVSERDVEGEEAWQDEGDSQGMHDDSGFEDDRSARTAEDNVRAFLNRSQELGLGLEEEEGAQNVFA